MDESWRAELLALKAEDGRVRRELIEAGELDVDCQQQALELLTAAVAQADAPAWQMAMLTDRVQMGRGQLQVYGSIHVGDARGRLVPDVTEDPEGVAARRAAVGLPPLADKTAELTGPIDGAPAGCKIYSLEAGLPAGPALGST